MSSGWIKVHRQLSEHDLWLSEPFTRGQAWVDLLLLANHQGGHIRRRGIRITVKRGQVGYSQEGLATRWKWSKGKVIRFLAELKEDERIHFETELKNIAVTTLITITNYEQYQGNSTEDETVDGPKTEPKTVLEQECKEGKEEKPIVPFAEIIGHLNLKAGKSFKIVEAHKRHIRSRWSEGHRLEDFKKVIGFKVSEWGADEKMSVYLRPETLFGTKFDSYLQASLKPAADAAPPVHSARDAELAEKRREVLAHYDN